MSYDSMVVADGAGAYYPLDDASGPLARELVSGTHPARLVGSVGFGRPGPILGDGSLSVTLKRAASGLVLPRALGVSAWSALSLEWWVKLGADWQYLVAGEDGAGFFLFLDGVAYTLARGERIRIAKDFARVLFFRAPAGLSKVALYPFRLSAPTVAAHYAAANPPAQGLAAYIGGQRVDIGEASLALSERSGQRSVATFMGIDDAGTQAFYQNQQVRVFLDGVPAARGYVDVVESERVPGPSGTKTHTLTSKDGRYLAEKRRYTGTTDFTNWAAGDIAVYLAGLLTEEGIAPPDAAQDIDQDATAFGQGTLLQVAMSESGALQLATDGTPLSVVEQDSLHFGAGTLTDVVAAGDGSLQLAPTYGIQVVGVATAAASGTLYGARVIWSGASPPTVASGDVLVYDLWIASTSAAFNVGVDLKFSDNSRLNTAGALDQNGLDAAQSTDLTGYARDAWYSRTIALTPVVGKTITAVFTVLAGQQAGPYTAYFKRVQLLSSSGSVKASFYNNAAALTNNSDGGKNGYLGVVARVVTTYKSKGTRVSPLYSPSRLRYVNDSLLSWQQDTVPATDVALSARMTGMGTPTPCSKNAPLPFLTIGLDILGRAFELTETLTQSSTDPTTTPVLRQVALTVTPAYYQQKADVLDLDGDAASFGMGTLSGVQAEDSGLHLSGFIRRWGEGDDTSNQTLFGSGSPTQGVNYQALVLSTDPMTQVRSRFDFAGSWGDFTTQCSIKVKGATEEFALLYRTTVGWQNNADTYAYSAAVTETSVSLIKGTNSASGAGSRTTIATAAASFTVDWHKLTLVVVGTHHQIYVDGDLYIDTTDASYTAAGTLGALYTNTNVSGRDGGDFLWFGVRAPAMSGTRVHPALDLTPLGTIASTVLLYQQGADPYGAIWVDVSTNGGSTWTTVPSGDSIPGLDPGTNVSGVSLLVRDNLSADEPSIDPAFAWVMVAASGAATGGGIRISPLLDISGITRIGSSSVTWQAEEPAETSVTVETSVDKGASWQVATNGGAIAGLGTPPPVWSDGFDTDTSASYTQTHTVFGSDGTWTWATATSRVSVTGGVEPTLVYAGALVANAAIGCVSDQAPGNGFGLSCRRVDSSNMYNLYIQDASAGSPNTFSLYKIVAGTYTLLASGSLAFVRGTYHSFGLSASGTQLTATMDGATLATVTDSSITAAGFCGLIGGHGADVQRFYSVRVTPFGPIPANDATVQSRTTLISTDPVKTPRVEQLALSVRGPGIDTGALIPKPDVAYQTYASIFDSLASASGALWQLWEQVFSFVVRSVAPLAPFLIQSTDLQASGIPKLVRNTTLYRNRQWATNALDVVTVTGEAKTGDGKNRTFHMAYPLQSAPQIHVNGLFQRVGVQNVDIGRQFYWKQGSADLIQDSGQDALIAGDAMLVDYSGQRFVDVMVEDTDQQDALARYEGGSGIIEDKVDATGLTVPQATAEAQALITEFAKLARRFEFTTLRAGLHADQLAYLFVPEHGIVDGSFLLVSVTPHFASQAGGGLFTTFDVVAVEGPNTGSWSRYFLPVS